MEWSEVGGRAVDSDEEHVFQSAIDEKLTYYNVDGDVEQDRAPPSMCGAVITATGVSSIGRLCPVDNFVSTGLLVRILEECQSLPECYNTASVDLFGFSFQNCTALVNPCVLFMMFRKRLQCLSSTSTPSETSFGGDKQKMMQQCSHFLHFIDCFVHRHIVTVAKQNQWTISLSEVTNNLAHNMMELLTELDPLILIDAQFSVTIGDSTINTGSSNQIGLLQVHTYWTVISTSYRLIVGLRSVLSNLLNDLTQNILSLLRLLLDLAAVRFNQVPQSMISEQFNVMLCGHTSVMELWLLAMQCLSHLGNKGYTESFWSLIIGELENYLNHHDNTIVNPPLMHDGQELVDSAPVAMTITVVPNQPISFCWWALSRIIVLLQYDSCGVYHNPEQPFKSDPVLSKFLQQLITCSLQLVGNTEESPLLKLHLSCFYSITMVIMVSYESIVLLWEHFYKQLTDLSYSISRKPVHNPQSLVTASIRQLYTHIKSISSTNTDGAYSYKEEENFQIFLRIIARVIHWSPKESSWKHLKGKILSKFYRKKMMELSNEGVSKFTQLFLVLAQVGDVSEVGKKMITLLSMRNLASPNEMSLTIIWRAIFVLLLAYSDMKCCFREISEIISPLINQIVSNLVTRSSDGSSMLLWDTVCVILNGIQELLDNSQSFTNGECALIGAYIGELLSCCKGNEIGRIVLFISDLIATINGHYCTINSNTKPTSGLLLESQDVAVEKLQHLEALSEMTSFLWQCVLPGLRSRVNDPTCSNQLAPLLVSLTDFSLDCVDLCRPHDNHGCYGDLLLEEFAFNDSLPAEFVSLYLSTALSSDVIRDHVMSHDSLHLQITHSWLRCVVQMHTPPACIEHVKQFTKRVVELNLIGSFQHRPLNAEPMATLKLLLGTINDKHSAAVTVMEASHWRDYCKHVIGDLCKYNIQLISGSLPSECMKMAYQVSSVVVRCCSKLIYSKVESRCLLPRLLDQLILPVTSEKNPLPRGIPLMIRSHLHHFLIGLMMLEPKRDDFIRRKIKQIFLKYFTSYAQRSQPNSLIINPGPNPFMLFLQPCFKPVVTAEERDTLLFTMELVTAHFLTPSSNSRSYLLPVFQYIGDVMDKINSKELLVRCSLLLFTSLLSCQLACETSTSHSTKPDKLKSLVVTLMRKLLQTCKRYPAVAPCSSLLPILRDYVVTNLKQHQAATLVPLSTVAMEYRSLMQLFLPSVKSLIEECSGSTSKLRSAYQSLCDSCNN